MIREEYKSAFLNEKNRKTIIIRFTETDEFIDARNIVDQGSFKYVESLNENDGVQLGYGGSTSLEIDIKGNLIDRIDEEIYVELVAYEENEEELKAYPIPIGFFVISDVNYNYNLDVSHLLCYSKLISDLSKANITKLTWTGNYLGLTNYAINVISEGLIPNEYIQETEIISIRKEITSDVYMIKDDYACYNFITGESRFNIYLTEVVSKYQACIYHLDKQYRKEYGSYSSQILIHFLAMVDEVPRDTYEREMRPSGYGWVRDNFWPKNSRYNYNSPPSGYSTWSDYKNVSPPLNYRLGGSNSLIIPYNTSPLTYKVSAVSGMSEPSLYAIRYTGVGYRYKNYVSNSVNVLSNAFPDDFSEVNWIIDNGATTDPNYFDELKVKYLISKKYRDIAEVSSNITNFPDMSIFDFVSDFAEVNGETIKLNRATGTYMSYTLFNDEGEYPSEHIYPLDTLYPKGDKNILHISKEMYSVLTEKIYQIKKVGRVLLKKGKDEFVSQVDDFNENKYLTIEIVDNVFIELSMADTSITSTILDTYKDFAFIPFELECTGLPWLEAGDWIIVETDDGQQRLNVNRRTLSGIQGMMDSLSAGGI